MIRKRAPKQRPISAATRARAAEVAMTLMANAGELSDPLDRQFLRVCAVAEAYLHAGLAAARDAADRAAQPYVI